MGCTGAAPEHCANNKICILDYSGDIFGSGKNEVNILRYFLFQCRYTFATENGMRGWLQLLLELNGSVSK